MARALPTVAIVVPCFNEQDVLPSSASILCNLIEALVREGLVGADSRVHFVDDGSTDSTWAQIEELAAAGRPCGGIKLSRNHGHQHALLAGLLTVAGDAVISVDADLQDDPAAIRAMIAAYVAGAEIVYGVRKGREVDSWFKRTTALGYYRFASWLGVRLIYNHADYRLLSRTAVEALRGFGEANLFLRGLIPQLGFNTSIVYYDRGRRTAGESKYPLRKMLALALDGITSFSAAPLRLITILGTIVAFGSFATALWALWVRAFNPAAMPGWASTVIPMYFLGGIQLLCTGIIGQYLSKVYIEVKHRPRFIVEKTI